MPDEMEVCFDDDPPSPPESFESAKPVPVKRAKKAEPRPLAPLAEVVPYRAPEPALTRVMPHNRDVEEHLIGCALIDPEETLRKSDEAKIDREDFYDNKHGVVWESLLDMRSRRIAIDVVSLREELKRRGVFEQVGGNGFLMEITPRTATTAQTDNWIRIIRDMAALRRLIIASTRAVEEAYNATGDVDEVLHRAKKALIEVDERARPVERSRRRGLFDFSLVSDNDSSVLLGKRYLNRGDIAVLSSTSGMGKSSMALQMATSFALGLPAFGELGITCNGPLVSLIIQSEDSEGDVAEVAAGLSHGMKLTDAQRQAANGRVHVITDRVNRGAKFIAALRRHIADIKPDLVWINPLQAFMDGDITESRDIGAFLREGLNSLNEPPTHAYMLVHHTTKPAKEVKGQSGPKWNEQMYEMAGGAEIINAARAIMILKATETEGNFNLVLAKRGKRAGAVKKVAVQEGMTFRIEPVTTIALRHANDWIELGGGKKMPAIFWETRAPDVAELQGKSTAGGRPSKHEFADWKNVFPEADGLPLAELHRRLDHEKPISKSTLHDALKRWVNEGQVEALPQSGGKATRYRRAKLPGK